MGWTTSSTSQDRRQRAAGRLRTEAALAALAGANPIPASSGQAARYRLNRGGIGSSTRALHTIVMIRATTLLRSLGRWSAVSTG